MALSEYELRVLREIEQDLQKPPNGRPARAWRCIAHRWPALLAVFGALAATVLLALFAPGAVAAPLALTCGVVAGGRGRAVTALRRRR